jgi:hypothetical protein
LPPSAKGKRERGGGEEVLQFIKMFYERQVSNITLRRRTDEVESESESEREMGKI